MGTRRARILPRLSFLFCLAVSCTRMPTAPPTDILVEGRITAQDGSPLEGASVRFFEADPALRTGYGDTETDPEGRYSVSLLTGTYDVQIHAQGNAYLDHFERVTFRRSSKRYDHRFTGFHVTGTLRHPDGYGLDSGIVWAILQTHPRPRALSRFDGGTFSLLLPEGTYSFEAWSPYLWSGLPEVTVNGISIHSDTTLAIDLNGIPVTGIALGRDHEPIDSVEVYAEIVGGGFPIRALTGSDGRYRIWVPPGTYGIHFEPRERNILPRAVGPVEATQPRTLDADFAGVNWTGVVRWRTSQDPVPGLSVRARINNPNDDRWAESVTDAGGGFRLSLEAGQPYSLYTYDGSGRLTHVPDLVAAADTSFELLLDPPAP